MPAISSGVSPFMRSATASAADLRGRRLAGEHLLHARARQLARQSPRASTRARDRRSGSSRSTTRSCCWRHRVRKFSISLSPGRVSTDSGWNCTPQVSCSLVLEPHDLALRRPRHHLEHVGQRSRARRSASGSASPRTDCRARRTRRGRWCRIGLVLPCMSRARARPCRRRPRRAPGGRGTRRGSAPGPASARIAASEMPASLRLAGPGRDHHALERPRGQRVDGDRVVAITPRSRRRACPGTGPGCR